MAWGLIVMAGGCLIFIPAAQARAFPLFLTGLFVQGMGLSLLQTASNPYISIIGPIESAAQRISIMGICNKVAGILSPLILSSIVLKNATAIETQINEATDMVIKNDLLNQLAGRVVAPYMVMAVVLAVLAVMIRRSSLPEIDTTAESNEEGSASLSAGRTGVWQFPHLVLGAVAIFVYVGAEVMAGDAWHLWQVSGFQSRPDEILYHLYPGRHVGGLCFEHCFNTQIHFPAEFFEIFRHTRHRAHSTHVFHDGLHSRILHCLTRTGQCRDVARYFPLGNQWIGTIYAGRFRMADHGYCRWRDHPAGVRVTGKKHRISICLPGADVALLPVHFVLCYTGLQTALSCF